MISTFFLTLKGIAFKMKVMHYKISVKSYDRLISVLFWLTFFCGFLCGSGQYSVISGQCLVVSGQLGLGVGTRMKRILRMNTDKKSVKICEIRGKKITAKST